MAEHEFFARCASGLEKQLAAELKSLKLMRIRPLTGGVAFFGAPEDAYRACLWSRVASRILLVVARIDAPDKDVLYANIRSTDWSQHLTESATLAVHVQGTNDTLRNTQFTAVRVKDAICDQLREKRGVRPDVQQKRPDVLIDVALRNEKATVAIDFSGEALHRRGYREDRKQSEAPLKENLAAGILLASDWENIAHAGGSFIDPLCGSGTLVIEAAMIAADQAPGIMRDYWGFTGWGGFNRTAWENLLDEADERAAKGLATLPHIAGGDIDEACIALAQENAKRAGLANHIEFQVLDAAHLGRLVLQRKGSGLVATNPPYGERLLSEAQLPALYASLAQGLDMLESGWQLAVITPDESIDITLGLTPFSTLPLFNGKIETMLRRYEIGSSERITLGIVSLSGTEKRIVIAERNSDQFAARFRKTAKERMKWARNNAIHCYRLYDADLPDYAVAIDLYEGAEAFSGQRFVHIAEYQAPSSVDADRARRRFHDVLLIVPELLDLTSDHLASKTRKRDKGGGQYRDAKGNSRIIYTTESNYVLEVDLGGYLDTGIFLDHRMTREMIGTLAKGKRFLNLFAYTGVATVHAAGGGAKSTKTVDLSQTYLAWAKRNMELNGFAGPEHSFVRADVTRWISEERASSRRYDLIFVDPPTFSNSKSMKEASWSVQRDHAELLIGVSRLLTDGGQAVFSCNARSFKPDIDTLTRYGVKLTDITAQTIPEDFSRNQKIHHCYLVERL